MANKLEAGTAICPYCEKPVSQHQSQKVMCSKIQRAIHRLDLIRSLSNQSALTVQPRDLSSIAEICSIIVKELES